MALARVGLHTGTNTAFASTVTCASWTATAGNMLVAIAEADTVASNGITITGNNSASFARVISTVTSGNFDLEVWVAYNIAGGAGQTVTAADNGGGVDSLIMVEEWSGAALTSALDQSTGQSLTGLSSYTSGNTAATSQANELIVGALAVTAGTVLTAGAGFTNLNTVTTAFSQLAFETKVVAATGVQAATATSVATSACSISCSTFKEAAAVGGSNSGFLSFMKPM